MNRNEQIRPVLRRVWDIPDRTLRIVLNTVNYTFLRVLSTLGLIIGTFGTGISRDLSTFPENNGEYQRRNTGVNAGYAQNGE